MAQDQRKIATSNCSSATVSSQQAEPSGKSRPKRVDVNLTVDGYFFKPEERLK